VLALEAFVIRYFGGEHGDRLLLVNLGRELSIDPAPEPLLAPQAGARWKVQWSSEDPRYGGFGTPPIEGDTGWHLPGESAIVMRPVRDSETDG
jgi:maltooligosyltrehalose trehalohydrolase